MSSRVPAPVPTPVAAPVAAQIPAPASLPVVVGVDSVGTSHGKALLDLAAHEARLRGVPLWLVHAYQWIPPTSFGLVTDTSGEEVTRGAAVALLEQASALVRAEHPDLRLETAAVSGTAAQSVAGICPSASLIIVGGRGRGGFAGQMLGSVALRVLTLAHCPVMVVRGDMHTTTRPVMIGVDVEAPATGPEPLEFALHEASLRNVSAHAVHACDWQECIPPEQVHYVGTDRRQALDALVEPWSGKYPDVDVTDDVFAGSPAGVLVDGTRTAGLIVLGGKLRAEGGDGMRLGALAHTVLHHAHCPVVVVPEH